MESTLFSHDLKVENVVFDLGGVLLTFNPEVFLPYIVDDDSDSAWCYQNILKGPHWAELDRGTLTIEEVKQYYIERAPQRRKSIEQMFDHWLQGFIPIIPSIEIVHSLKEKGYRVFLLSNFIKEYFEVIYQKYDFFTLFDGIAVSYQMKAIKPEPEIYKQTMRRFSLTSSNAVFIDDVKKNVEASIQAGLPALRFTFPAKLCKDLKKIKVHC